MIHFLLAKAPNTPGLSAGDVLAPYIYVFYIAFLVAFLFTPVMRAVALYYGIIDQPDNLRKIHKEPVAYLGGVAVFLGWIAGLAISQFLFLHHRELGGPSHVVVKFSIVIGAIIIMLLGLWDDIYRLKPWVKISGQVFAALFLLMDDLGTHCTQPLLEPLGQRLQFWFGWPAAGTAFFPEWFVILSSSALVLIGVVGFCNASNLMDGLDGLCGGVTAIIAAGFLFVAVHLATMGTPLNTNWDALRIVLALALLGAVLGFVPFNFNPASIFMGDTGSMLLGYCCAVMVILMGQGQHPKWFLASIVMFALPVLDTTLAFARRWLAGRPLFSADRHHFHHQLVSRGYTVKQTVLVSYSLAIGFALLGAAIVFMRTRFAVAFYLVIFGCIMVAAYKLGMVHERPLSVQRKGLDADSEMDTTVEPANVLEIRPAPGATTNRPPNLVSVSGTWPQK